MRDGQSVRKERERREKRKRSERGWRADGVSRHSRDGAGNKAETVRCVTSSLAPSREARSTE